MLIAGRGNEGGAVSSQSRVHSLLLCFCVTVKHPICKRIKERHFFTVTLLPYLGVVSARGGLCVCICTFVAACKSRFQSAAADLLADPDTDQWADNGGGRLYVPIVNF